MGILLCKLRLGLLNELLSILFELPDKKAVSRAVESARNALMSEFVPSNVGFNHISRQEIINLHMTNIAKQLMCGNDDDTAVVVVDSTYIYIQVKNKLFTPSFY